MGASVAYKFIQPFLLQTLAKNIYLGSGGDLLQKTLNSVLTNVSSKTEERSRKNQQESSLNDNESEISIKKYCSDNFINGVITAAKKEYLKDVH